MGPITWLVTWSKTGCCSPIRDRTFHFISLWSACVFVMECKTWKSDYLRLKFNRFSENMSDFSDVTAKEVRPVCTTELWVALKEQVTWIEKGKTRWLNISGMSKRGPYLLSPYLKSRVCGVQVHLRVKLFGKDEVGWSAGDGDEATNGGSVRDAQRQAFTDHMIPLGGVLGVPPGFDPLQIWDLNGYLKENNGRQNVAAWIVQ